MDKDELITKKRQEYLGYIYEHVKNVQKAWQNMMSVNAIKNKITSLPYADNIFTTTADNIKAHDKSKYSEEEFEPYRRHFHYIDEKEKEESNEDFEKAWEHHKENNLHHWDWWAEHNKADKMGIPFVLEMCCDWIAMSMKFKKNNAYEWYLENQDNIILGVLQKSLMESILTTYYKYFDIEGNRIR